MEIISESHALNPRTRCLIRAPHNRTGAVRRDVAAVVVIIGLLLTLLLPLIYHRRIQSRQQLCEARQMWTAQAVLFYESTQGQFPGYRNLQAVDAAGQRQPCSWVLPVLPFLIQLSDQVVLDVMAKQASENPADPAALKKLLQEKQKYLPLYEQYGPGGPDATRGLPPQLFVPELVCPDHAPANPSEHPNWTSFVANCGQPDAIATGRIAADWLANGVFTDQFTVGVQLAPPTTLEYIKQHDGAAHVLMLAENVDAGRWTDVEESRIGFVWVANFVDGQPAPGDRLWRINQHRGEGDGSLRFARPSSNHVGGVNVAFCNGATKFLNQDIDYLVLARMMMSDSRDVKVPGADVPLAPPYRLEATNAPPQRDAARRERWDGTP